MCCHEFVTHKGLLKTVARTLAKMLQILCWKGTLWEPFFKFFSLGRPPLAEQPPLVQLSQRRWILTRTQILTGTDTLLFREKEFVYQTLMFHGIKRNFSSWPWSPVESLASSRSPDIVLMGWSMPSRSPKRKSGRTVTTSRWRWTRCSPTPPWWSTSTL